MDKKDCILITSHLNNKIKVDVALEQIELLRNCTDLPIIFVGNFPIPRSIQRVVDMAYYDKRNEMITQRLLLFWDLLQPDDTLGSQAKLMTRVRDHGAAHLHQIRRGAKFCESNGYTHMFHFNYDVFMSEEDMKCYIDYCKNENNLLFEFKRFNDHDVIEDPDCGHIGSHTRIFYVNIDDYVSAIDKELFVYPKTDIPHDKWVCENWLNWCLNKHNFKHTFIEKYHVLKNKYKLGDKVIYHVDKIHISNSEFWGGIKVYWINDYNGIKDKYLIWDKHDNFKRKPTLNLTVDETNVEAIRTHNGMYEKGWKYANVYLVDVLDGDYYLEDQYLFTGYEGLKSECFVEGRQDSNI